MIAKALADMCSGGLFIMVDAVGAGGSPAYYQAPKAPATSELSSGGSGALPDAPSAFDIALQIQDVQAKNFRRALDAKTIVLDLLV